MVLPFLGLFIMLIAAISFYSKRSTRHQQELNDSFWEREQKANFVRRQDISGLPYINIPFEDFSIGAFTDSELNEIEEHLLHFRDKKILNLNNQTNTDLKLQYGPANLPILTEYDQNFTDMLQLLTRYSNRLFELEQPEAALPVLTFCIEAGSDISAQYVQLAKYYKANGQIHKIESLKEKASHLDSLMKTSILQKLDTLLSE